mmetsp:Transcript_22936/g.39197  ORF Transcript_22936/g.39197 Transcript_22936/m.39197 type:complete len:235 (+) Transcript_22936:4194-4898(+)
MTETQIHQSTMTSKLPRPPDALHQLQHIWTHQMLLKIPLPTPPRMPPRMQTTTMPLPLPLLPPLPLALSLPTNMVHQPTRRPALMSGYENTQGNVRVATPTFRNAEEIIKSSAAYAPSNFATLAGGHGRIPTHADLNTIRRWMRENGPRISMVMKGKKREKKRRRRWEEKRRRWNLEERVNQMEVASSPSTGLRSDQMIPMSPTRRQNKTAAKLVQAPTVVATLTKTSAKCWKI